MRRSDNLFPDITHKPPVDGMIAIDLWLPNVSTWRNPNTHQVMNRGTGYGAPPGGTYLNNKKEQTRHHATTQPNPDCVTLGGESHNHKATY